jgi:hypothetical protein
MKTRTLIALLGLTLLATLLLGSAGFEGMPALAEAQTDAGGSAAAIPSLHGLLRNVFGLAS